jgi:AraC-like DNA-binding protein
MGVSIVFARGLAEAVDQAGFDRANLLDSAGVDPSLLADVEGRLDIERYDRLVGAALAVTGDPALGLRIGETAHGPTYNLVAHLVAHARTLRDGVQALIRFQRLLSDRPTFRIVESARIAKLVCDEYPGSEACYRTRVEMMVTGLYRLVHYFVRDARLDRVAFDYAAPSYHRAYARVFGDLPEFDQPFAGVVLSRELLDATQPNHDADFQAVLEAQAERRISRLTGSATYADQVREYVIAHPPQEMRTMEAAARALGMSARSLRRRLSEEGACFQRIVDDALHALSRQHLSNRRRSIKEIASALGYSEQAGFCRAFRRWSGTSPTEYRARRARAN